MENFITQLLADQGVDPAMDPAVRAQLVAELTSKANDLINRRLIDAMSDEVVSHFNDLVEDENTDAAAVQQFITTNVPNRDQVVAAALIEFRALYLGEKA